MKKRMLSILLTLCMVLCLAPVGVYAEGETTKKVETEQELVDALADSTVDVITLKSDIAVSSTLIVKRAVTLDIYGYMLEMKGSGSVIAIQDGGDLTLEDSDPKALYMFKPDANGLWKWVASGGTKAVRGGVIYGGTGTVFGSFTIGGGVYVYDGGRFTMNGGSIVGCTAAGPVAYGGGVCIYGRFTMNGGNIVGCTAVGDYDRNPVAYGGGVYVTGIGTFTMTGGSIIGCTAATSDSGMFANGGGIYNIGDTTLSGTAEIRDCHVKATVGMRGGGIASDDGPINISGDVKVSGCTAGGQGSDAVYIYRGTISSGTFYGSVANWATISGGTFYDSVTNYRTITGGMFYGGITNYENRGKIDGLTVTCQVNGADYATQILRSGAAATKPDDPTKDDYVFAGWFNGDAVYDFTGSVTGDITLTAKWTKIADKTADFTA